MQMPLHHRCHKHQAKKLLKISGGLFVYLRILIDAQDARASRGLQGS